MVQSPVIHIENITKFYGQVVGVSNIAFDVFPGEIFGFLGPNGAGKTTAIRLLLDLLRPSSGKITIFGKDLSKNSFEIRKKCGYLPGEFSAYGNLSGMEFLRLCADLRNISRKIDPRLFERFDLTINNLNRKIKYLSHGTLQKLGIMQAFFHEPELLILDEPTTGLDPLMQEAFYELLLEQQRKGCTVLLSSHNLLEVEKICHRMAIIRKGEIGIVESIENLKKTLKKRLQFTLLQPVADIELPGAELWLHEGLYYEYILQGDIRAILKRLAGLPLADVTLPEPGLDEIFINFYKEKNDD